MKILFVLTYYAPHWTGLTKYAVRLAEALAKNNHQVEVVCSRHNRSLPENETINKVRIYRANYLFRLLRSVISLTLPFILIKSILNTDIVVVYLPYQEVPFVAIVARLLRKKLYLVHNGDLVLPLSSGLIGRLIEMTFYLFTSFSLCLANGVFVQSVDYSRNSKLLSHFKDKWRVVLPLFEIPNTITADITKFKIKHQLQNKILIGYSGRFVEEKGVDYLLAAIPQVIKQIPTAHFVFAGDYKIKYERYWDMIAPLIDKYRQHITLFGLIADPADMFAFYRALDVYVQPSRTDCFPSSQIEALLAGTPSVCTNIPGSRWAVKSSGMGVVVDARSPDALAKGIVEVVNNRITYVKYHSKVQEIYNYQKTVKDYEQVFVDD